MVELKKGYPHPANFDGAPDKLYQNDGRGKFVDITSISKIYNESGKGLGVVFADYNLDGWSDIYVANDAVRNFLYYNRGNGTFQENGIMNDIFIILMKILYKINANFVKKNIFQKML